MKWVWTNPAEWIWLIIRKWEDLKDLHSYFGIIRFSRCPLILSIRTNWAISPTYLDRGAIYGTKFWSEMRIPHFVSPWGSSSISILCGDGGFIAFFSELLDPYRRMIRSSALCEQRRNEPHLPMNWWWPTWFAASQSSLPQSIRDWLHTQVSSSHHPRRG